MNAPALNPASTPISGPAGTVSAANAAGQTGGALAGFEALLGALFPQGVTPVSQAVTPEAVPAASASGKTALTDLLGSTQEVSDTDPTEDGADLAADDVGAGLPTGVFVGPPLIINTLPDLSTDTSGVDRGKANLPGSAAIASSPAPLQDDTAPAPASADRVQPDLPSVSAAPANAGQRRAEPPPIASAPPTTQLQPSATDLPDAATQQIAALAAETGGPSSPATLAAASAPVLAAAGLVPRPEPTPIAPTRAAKTDRSRTSTDAGSASEPVATAARDTIATALTAKPVVGDVRTAAVTQETPDTEIAEKDVAADTPDGTAQAEARATAQSLTPTAHSAPGVRGSPETVATLAAQIIKKLEGQSTRFDVELNPAGLGKVDVRIDIGAHGRISAAMMFDNAGAAADLRARATELQRMLEQAGFDMSGGLSFDVAGDRGQQQRQTWQEQNNSSGHAFGGQAFRAALDTADAATDAAVNGALRLRRGVSAGLDLRI